MSTSLRVLLIEDSQDDALLLVRELRRGGYEPTWERVDTAAALRAALARQDWDVITCDYIMPQFSAPAALALIADLGIDAPIIIVSGEVGEDVAVTAMKAGAHDLVSKHNLTRLVPAIERELHEAGERRTHRQAEAALWESEGRYRSLFENMLEGFAYCRMLFEHDQPRDFIYLDVNSAFEKLTGLKNVVGRKVTEVIPGIRESHPELFEIYGRVASTGRPERLELYLQPLAAWLSISVYSTEKGCFVAVFDNITERKRAEAALRATEERLRALVEHAFDVISLSDADGNISYVSPSNRRVFGRDPEAHTGRKWAEYLHADDLERCDAWRRKAVANPGQPITDEVRLRHKNGSWRWIEATVCSLLDNPSVQAVVFNSRDITERKQAEEALRASEQKYRDLVETSHDWIWAVDAEGRVTFTNRAVKRILGYEPGECLGRPFVDFGLPEDAPQHLRVFERVRAGEPLFEYEMELRRKDGPHVLVRGNAVRLCDQSGTVTGITGTAVDITESRRLEDELRRTTRRLQSYIEQASDLIFTLDAAGKITSVNPAVCQSMGYAADELLGKNALELVAPEDRSEMQAALGEIMAGSTVAEVEAGIIAKDGHRITLDIRGGTIREGEHVIETFHIARDVTERKHAEEARAQLRQAQKLEAIGRLAGGVAHDFNNQLTVIKSCVEFMLAKLPATDPCRRDADRINATVEKSTQLIRQLLSFSRRQPIEAGSLCLNDLLTEMAPLLRLVLDSHTTLRVHSEARLWPVRADRVQIEQVIMNLVVNASDALAAAGEATAAHTVSIETVNVELDDFMSYVYGGNVEPGPYAMLVVSDNGPGMSPEVQQRIFEPFFTTKEVGKGTGLGLATVFGIVRQHRGYIACVSELGRGTTFRVYLPRDRGSETALAAPVTGAADAGHPPPQQRTVLIAEDEENVREVFVRALEDAGYRVLSAGAVEEALAVATTNAHPIDLVVTDMVMPGGSGRTLARRLLQTYPAMRVLFVSGYHTDPLDLSTLPNARFLQKPFGLDELLRAVDELLTASEQHRPARTS